MSRSGWLMLAALVAALVVALPRVSATSEAQPTADEQCVAQCDTRSDRCMAEAGADENKQQACDDAYTECLQQCR